jgi:hypothetical protein
VKVLGVLSEVKGDMVTEHLGRVLQYINKRVNEGVYMGVY